MCVDQLRFYKTEKGYLLAPESFFLTDKKYNGCGPEGAGELVPDTIWGLSVTEVCCVHDHMSERCSCLTDEIITDAVMAANLVMKIVNDSDGVMTWLRMLIATKYMIGVSCTVYTKSYWEENKVTHPNGRYFSLFK